MENNVKSNDDHLVEERRKFVRLNINVEINYTVITHPPHKQFVVPTKSRNVGAGGICLLADLPLKAGDLLKLEIFLPEDPPSIHAIGKVAWVKPFAVANENNLRYDAGVEFTEILEADRKKVNKYVFSLKIK